MGDEVMIILSETICLLPMLEGIYIADNQLTDLSLVPFINSLHLCKHLSELAALALREFLSSKHCTLTYLSMAKANIDDYEVCA
eukprot:gene29933-39735_t